MGAPESEPPLSKKHSARRLRKKRARKRGRSKSPAALLTTLADSLNACERAGMTMHAGHGGLIHCLQGVVLPPVKKGQKWEARPFPKRPDALLVISDGDD